MAKPTPARIDRTARLRWVPIAQMRVNPLAQRDVNQAWVDRIAEELDVEQIGNPTVNLRGGVFWIIDGQHRIEALRQTGWDDQQIQCWTYEGLSQEEEADAFLRQNDRRAVDAFAKFRTAVTAGRDDETDIERIVQANGLVVSRDAIPGAIRAVGTLRRIYARSGGEILGRTLRIIRDAYGDGGLEALVLDGVGLVAHRYNGELGDTAAVAALSKAHGGVNGLLGRAETMRAQMGKPKTQCVAAAALETINRGRPRGQKLPDWWKS